MMMVSPISCWLLSLPDEMVLNCFARVSRVDLNTLSMVSKRCCSLVLSPELYKTRSRIGCCTEECVYVFFHTPRESTPLWFILNRVKGKSFENKLIPISSFQTPLFSSIVTFGGGIYVIGGLIESQRTSLVSFLDCRTHTWSYLPSMRFARSGAEVSVLDGRIYVMGGCGIENRYRKNWAEVFDPKMQTWSGVKNIRDTEIQPRNWLRDVWVKGIYNFLGEEGMWNLNKQSYCDMKRLLYRCSCKGEIMWCDPWREVRTGRMMWKTVHGLEEGEWLGRVLPGGEMADVWHCYLVNFGCSNGHSFPEYKLTISDGNIIMFWNKCVEEEEPKRMQIWCTEISIERREGTGEVWGTVQWSQHVYTVDHHLPLYYHKVLHTVSVAI